MSSYCKIKTRRLTPPLWAFDSAPRSSFQTQTAGNGQLVIECNEAVRLYRQFPPYRYKEIQTDALKTYFKTNIYNFRPLTASVVDLHRLPTNETAVHYVRLLTSRHLTKHWTVTLSPNEANMKQLPNVCPKLRFWIKPSCFLQFGRGDALTADCNHTTVNNSTSDVPKKEKYVLPWDLRIQMKTKQWHPFLMSPNARITLRACGISQKQYRQLHY